ncbi:MAG: 5-methyltetrahydropteroyltriglutamate--homocysteine methyltransferase [Solirubrobacteraceae bacterium]|nr:5-methyltetrahydropteroyltriglutamate--homocysteine methyltransferase [Solirubrobacteraceae bacterium]
MERSTDRILSTHVGSLARPHPLLELMREKEHGRPYDEEAYEAQVTEAVRDVVRRQVEAGLDIVTDGEMSKVSFVSYIEKRLGGLEARPGTSMMPRSWELEVKEFPEYYKDYFGKYSQAVAPLSVPVCTGPVTYEGQEAVATDIANLEAALGETPAAEAFLPSTSPAIIAENEYYKTDDEFLEAVAEALREEWLAIVDAGFLVQLDDPWLIEMLTDDTLSEADRHKAAEAHIERINHALRGIPEDRVRMHTCYGLNHGPRVHDLPLSDVVPYMLKVNAGAYSFEVANPRHQHEWRVWEDNKLEDGKLLIPGFLSHATAFVEHPELIADGIETYAKLVGRENVIAGADCGYSSRASFAPEVHPTVVWAKFAALSEGAKLASERLY